MRVKGVTRSQLDQAVLGTGLIYNRPPSIVGNWLSFTVRVESSRDRYHRRHFSGAGRGSRRGVSACWHGHRDMMLALFNRVPNAVLVSGLARYESRAHFLATFKRTGGAECVLPVQSGAAFGVLRLPGAPGRLEQFQHSHREAHHVSGHQDGR